ncbi:MAG TPA: NPCBM/NEW2 domain-containing protein [Pirellulaceae bacterium]|nr:NPCBM/NEW2 domain-containing protein [Pirellulaceae bacterium]
MNCNGWCFLVGVLLLASLPSSAESADPAWYLKKETWQETMLRSREALVEAEREKASTSRLKSYTSEIVRGGEVARRISVPVSGAKELFLFVTGAPDTVWGAATWADAKLIAKDGTASLVGQLDGRQVVEGRFDVDRNMKAGVSGPLKINGRRFDHGVHVYANSEI